MHMRRTADRLFGNDYQWSILAAGPPPDDPRHHRRDAWAAMSASASRTASISAQGGSPRAMPSRSRKIRSILAELSLDVATPDEARAMLKLKGGDQVAF